MSESKNNFEKIDDFIMGKLKGEELNSFNLELASNEELSAAVEQRNKLYHGIREAGRKEFVADLKEIHKDVIGSKQKPSKVIKFNWRPLLMVASTLLVVITSWWLWSGNENDPNSLFASNYEPYALNQNLRDDSGSEDFVEGAKLYREKNYAESLPIFQKLAEKNNSPSLKMAIAISHFENDNTPRAIETLQEIIASEDPFLSDLANWYSALFYIKLDEKENAKSHLEILASSSDNDKYEESKLLLSKLK